ncbi:CKLF-like MARVEL transmembrane domain-containing protein 3, partial [Leptonychotes weddellii]|uniref:CKLF-like MARVEL transmembrane domain-containing protein 3 n=1 Tax=Leptonychotes weddellii TaxID=9713 RepID=A0A7F8QN34_LEPWE
CWQLQDCGQVASPAGASSVLGCRTLGRGLCKGSDFTFPHLQGLSFITFVCYVASSASAFLAAPLLEFLLALYFLFADAMQLNDKWQGLCWPMMDFLRCVTAALIYFAISITAVAKYSDGASKAAGVFGFFATIVFAIDFYLIFNDVAKFLKQGDSAEENTADKEEAEHSDSESD